MMVLKNKQETKRKLILAVGEIIKTKGFAALKISKISKLADVDRKLIYRYFGGLAGLIESYVIENDYTMVFSETFKEVAIENGPEKIKAVIIANLQNLFNYFYAEKDMQRLILWEISTENPLMRSIHNAREANGQKILEFADLHFEGSNVNIRAVMALLSGGVYYNILHARFNGGIFNDLDITTGDGNAEIHKAIGQVINWAFEMAQKGSQ